MVGVGRSAKNSESKGTTMKKSSQNELAGASVPAMPEPVSVAMGEIAANMHEGLLALAVGAGLQVMAALMESDVTALVGPKGRHNAGRIAVPHRRERGSVTLGGRRVPITRPRVRPPTGWMNYRSHRMSCSARRRSWARWRWRRCWPACRPAVIRSG